jgi:hypothetical protein
VVFVGTSHRLYRSVDGGASFQAVIALDNSELFDAVAPDFQTPGTVYAATRGQRFKSTESLELSAYDGGVTWESLNDGLPERLNLPYYAPLSSLIQDPSTASASTSAPNGRASKR